MKANVDLDVDAIIDKLLEVRGYLYKPAQSQASKSTLQSRKLRDCALGHGKYSTANQYYSN
jgi:hypothetical protein